MVYSEYVQENPLNFADFGEATPEPLEVTYLVNSVQKLLTEV